MIFEQQKSMQTARISTIDEWFEEDKQMKEKLHYTVNVVDNRLCLKRIENLKRKTLEALRVVLIV